MNLIRYTADRCQEWNEFVKGSRNGTFLFMRGYMDYHADRFSDHSLMFYDSHNRLVALLPANERQSCIYSHQGLTYGGFILSSQIHTPHVGELFSIAMEYYKNEGFVSFRYKQMPSIYHVLPSQEDDYWLWRIGASLESCLVSTTIPLCGNSLPRIERRRRRGERRAVEKGYAIEESDSLELFWPIMESNLSERYGLRPVHTLDEMQLLKSRFPDHIKLFLVKDAGKAVAGCVAYLANERVVHIQYGHATPEGKDNGALDMLYLSLIDKYRKEGYWYFDFGNSNEENGRVLNEKLIAQKEGFGGSAVVYRTFLIELN